MARKAAVGAVGVRGIEEHACLIRRHGPHFDGWTQGGIVHQIDGLREVIATDGFLPLYAYESGELGGEQVVRWVIRVSRVDVFPDGWDRFLDLAHDEDGGPGQHEYPKPAHARTLYEEMHLLEEPLTLADLTKVNGKDVLAREMSLRFVLVRVVDGTIPDAW